MSKNIAKITDRIILKLLILCKVPLLHPKWAGASRILCKQRNLPRLTGVKVRNNHQEASNEGEAKQWRNEGLRWPFPSLNHPPSTVTSCPPSLTNISLETATLAYDKAVAFPSHPISCIHCSTRGTCGKRKYILELQDDQSDLSYLPNPVTLCFWTAGAGNKLLELNRSYYSEKLRALAHPLFPPD